ncbi:unnamed protein product [Leptidea sinapis]|uniref:Odorant receptor n=1 Tax=Leptidea sinapis TaxID=189913 RepID=A0A5E4PR38_9NEOP|nr:unnamed protein product [Leptidea sinapis]
MDGTLQVFDRVLSFVGISIFAKGNWHSNGWMIIQIFNFFLGFLTFIFSSGVIMCISLAICLIHKKDFEKFVEEMAFRDPALSMPIVQFALKCDKQEGKIKELKTIVEDSHSQLFDMTRILLLTYVASVWFCVTLYISGPIYQMIVSVNESQRSLAFDMWFPWSLDNMADKFSVDIVKYYVHELCFILVVFMFCYLGQQVENQCEYLERVVLESWYIYDKKHIKHVLIFKMALDQRMPIYIFGTITLSLPTFTWFIKNGMSFFTLVMSVLERRN